MKRVTLEVDLPRGPQHYWSEMCRLSREQGGFTITEIHGLTNGRTRKTIKAYVLFLASEGHIKPVSTQPTNSNREAIVYKVEREAREAPIQRRPDFADRRGRSQEQIWNAMRFIGNFTIRELATAASTDTHPVTESEVRTYVFRLINAGYVATIDPAVKMHKAGVYRLKPSKNTGPKPPAIVEASFVYDRNLEAPMGSIKADGAVS